LSGSIPSATGNCLVLFQDSKDRVLYSYSAGTRTRTFRTTANPTSSWTIDETFQAGPTSSINGAIEVDISGSLKYVVWSTGNQYSGSFGNPNSTLFIINEDGSRYHKSASISSGFGVNKVLVNSGSIYAFGLFTKATANMSGVTASVKNMVKYDMDFNMDMAYSASTGVGLQNTVTTAYWLPGTEKFLIGGNFTSASGQPRRGWAMYSSSGQLL
jgi:hypothetical protein